MLYCCYISSLYLTVYNIFAYNKVLSFENDGNDCFRRFERSLTSFL